MSIQKFFPTQLWISQAPARVSSQLNRKLAREARMLEQIDSQGVKWCRKNYKGGYTSYASITDMPYRSSNFAELKRWIDGEAKKFAQALDMDLMEGRLEMTTCWVNVMRQHCMHSYHLHPLSAISGTYYVEIPKDSGAFKIEDPRLPAFMGSPPRTAKAKIENKRFQEFQPQAGQLILFESWLKHEVPQNHSSKERISVSFNYDWIR
ncbi:MAG: hypothetical protein KGQ59_05655 [Bdellovibrionales bacterium]|nr:hypothetical protein [Bdellovibrionales bacterium]